MNSEEALQFLKVHQPFPDGELELDQPFLDSVKEVTSHFKNVKDNRCVPLFVKCLSYSSLMGLLPEIESLLLYEYPREIVIPELASAIRSPNDGTSYRAILLSSWYRDRFAFIDLYREILCSDRPEILRLSTADFIGFIVTKEDIPWIMRLVKEERNEEIKVILERVVRGIVATVPAQPTVKDEEESER